jgi:sec-independent protein translocase protein TatB
MFDISWSEFLLIGVVALVVIGPKELPAVMRTLGQWTRKVRSMASDFQNQFQEAMREAEMADLKKEVDDLAQDVKNFDPLKDVRADVESATQDVKRSLEAPADTPPPALTAAAAEPVLTETPVETSAETPPAAFEAAAPAVETPAATTAVAAPPPAPGEQPAREMETIGAGVPAATAEPIEKTAQNDGTGRTG